jgi:hypothetical protein
MSADSEIRAQRADLVESWKVRGLKLLYQWGWEPVEAMKVNIDTWQINLPEDRNWAKVVASVDPKLAGGYALIGDWVKKTDTQIKIIAWWHLLVLQTHEYLEAYIATDVGVFKKRFLWSSATNKKEIIEELKKVHELKTYIFGLITVQGRAQELGPVPEWLAFPFEVRG